MVDSPYVEIAKKQAARLCRERDGTLVSVKETRTAHASPVPQCSPAAVSRLGSASPWGIGKSSKPYHARGSLTDAGRAETAGSLGALTPRASSSAWNLSFLDTTRGKKRKNLKTCQSVRNSPSPTR